MTTSHDLIVVGGGIAGSSLALVMARHGASVLVLEREERFKDRVRGECVHVWGTVEARDLGVYEPLAERCGHVLRSMVWIPNSSTPSQRDLVETTPSRGCELTFYHPEMQQTLIELAQAAGATIWRGALVTDVRPGDPPAVEVRLGGETREIAARLVIGADGRRSRARVWSGFTVEQDANQLVLTGVLVSGLPADTSATYIYSVPDQSWITQFIPLRDGRCRVYFGGDRERTPRLSGATGVAGFLNHARRCGVPGDWLDSLRIEGPLAGFESACWWVDRPYRDGVALIGDAAAAPDPFFGNGLSLSLRDVRVLSQRLLGSPDWDSAARSYAREHDHYFTSLHTLEQWATVARYSVGPETQPARDFARTALAQGDAPDIVGRGPDQPADAAARRRFLGY